MTALNKENQRFQAQCKEKIERHNKLENETANEASFQINLAQITLESLQ